MIFIPKENTVKFISIISIIFLSSPFMSSVAKYDRSSTDAFDNRVFNDQSPFNMKIPENVQYEGQSTQIMNNIRDSNQGGDEFVLGITAWTYPIYFAEESTPKYDVVLTEQYTEDSLLEDMPIPNGALPDPQGDGHLVVIDNSTGIEWDLWMAERLNDNSWQAGWGNKISLSTTGIYPVPGLSARGSGTAASTGVIWKHEIDQGHIDHALFLSLDDVFVKGGGPITPFSESDGESTDPLAIPEGARLQLDPNLDLDSLGLNYADKVIAKCMQDYGIFLGDRGGGFALYARNPNGQDWNWDEYFSIAPNEGYALLFDEKISIGSLKLLKMGPVVPEGGPIPTYEIFTESSEPSPWLDLTAFTIAMVVLFNEKRRKI